MRVLSPDACGATRRHQHGDERVLKRPQGTRALLKRPQGTRAIYIYIYTYTRFG